jgi:hypothetical protein
MTEIAADADDRRQCPLCLTVGKLSPSHRRNSHETFLGVVAPFIRPFRCGACNWRGMMGRLAILRHRNLNITLNAIIHIAVLIAAIYALIEIREWLHPTPEY